LLLLNAGIRGNTNQGTLVMAQHTPWSRNELLVAFRLYCHTPFGKLHQHNREIIELSGLIGRTPSAVAMKACNFASLDPAQQARKIRALGNVSNADRILWEEFWSDGSAVAAEAEAAYELLTKGATFKVSEQVKIPSGPTDVERTVRARRVQAFFRSTVLNSYQFQCALTGISDPALLSASHIIPWRFEESRRADPTNGICLNSLHDRAFDRGLITFDEDWRLVISKQIRDIVSVLYHKQSFHNLVGQRIRLPERFLPDSLAMNYHRNSIFIG
jgi:putative restriction endonuclease